MIHAADVDAEDHDQRRGDVGQHVAHQGGADCDRVDCIRDGGPGCAGAGAAVDPSDWTTLRDR